MTLARLLYILGIVLVAYAIISGIKLSFTIDSGVSFWDTSYQFKVGAFLLGLVFLYLGRKSS